MREESEVVLRGKKAMSNPAATTARIPLTPRCSAVKNTKNGMQTSNTT